MSVTEGKKERREKVYKQLQESKERGKKVQIPHGLKHVRVRYCYMWSVK